MKKRVIFIQWVSEADNPGLEIRKNGNNQAER